MLIGRLKENLISAMKEKNQLRVSTFRMINAAIKDLEISKRSKDKLEKLTEEDIIGILVKMVKQRKESATTYKDGNRDDSCEAYKKGGRNELLENEMSEIKIINEFLPKQLSENEINRIIEELISKNNITDNRGIGLIMSELKKNYTGQLDFGLASKIIKDKINI